jgi:hypothetical protein
VRISARKTSCSHKMSLLLLRNMDPSILIHKKFGKTKVNDVNILRVKCFLLKIFWKIRILYLISNAPLCKIFRKFTFWNHNGFIFLRCIIILKHLIYFIHRWLCFMLIILVINNLNKKVFRFQIPMYDTPIMHIPDPIDHFINNKCKSDGREFSFSLLVQLINWRVK